MEFQIYFRYNQTKHLRHLEWENTLPKRMMRFKRNQAARKIQRWFRKQLVLKNEAKKQKKNSKKRKGKSKKIKKSKRLGLLRKSSER